MSAGLDALKSLFAARWQCCLSSSLELLHYTAQSICSSVRLKPDGSMWAAPHQMRRQSECSSSSWISKRQTASRMQACVTVKQPRQDPFGEIKTQEDLPGMYVHRYGACLSMRFACSLFGAARSCWPRPSVSRVLFLLHVRLKTRYEHRTTWMNEQKLPVNNN